MRPRFAGLKVTPAGCKSEANCIDDQTPSTGNVVSKVVRECCANNVCYRWHSRCNEQAPQCEPHPIQRSARCHSVGFAAVAPDGF